MGLGPLFLSRMKSLLIPSSVFKAAALDENTHALLILLDGTVFVELQAKSHKALEKVLAGWKAETLPSLARSDVRFFAVNCGKVFELTLFRSKR